MFLMITLLSFYELVPFPLSWFMCCSPLPVSLNKSSGNLVGFVTLENGHALYMFCKYGNHKVGIDSCCSYFLNA